MLVLEILFNPVLALVYFVLLLAIIPPSISVSVRRLHDIGMSGWWWWLLLVPVVGLIVLLIFHVLAGEGKNKYGPNPLNIKSKKT